MRRILITGGAGFIGSRVVQDLYESHEWDITVLDALTEQIHGSIPENSYLFNLIKGKCHFIKGNVLDLETVKKAVGENEYILHLAAETGTGQSMYQINKYNEVNIMGTSNILQAISLLGTESPVRKIVLSSSRSVYGEGKYECPNCGSVYPIGRKMKDLKARDYNLYCPKCGAKLELVSTTEDSEVHPSSLYAYTKYAQEKMLQTMCPALNVEYTIFRLQNVYGVGQSLRNPYTGILSIFSTQMLNNKPVNIFEDGKESRDFINVKDISKGIISCFLNNDSNSQIINLGSGINTSVIEIAEHLKTYYKSNSELRITGDFRLGDIAHNKADISKAKSILNFNPDISLEEGLRDFCDWVMTQEVSDDKYQISLNEMEESGMLIRNNKQ